jgi:ABC-type lipoprotein release transport system permease subunit
VGVGVGVCVFVVVVVVVVGGEEEIYRSVRQTMQREMGESFATQHTQGVLDQ